MTTPQAITSEIQKLEPSAIVELFELDATSMGGDVQRFHGGTNGLLQPVVWQGNSYQPFPIQASGFDYSGNGQMPRPKVTVANISGAISLLVMEYDDLLGAKLTRKRTLVKYLDEVNFPARRNLFLQSADVSVATWTKTNTAAAGSAILSPIGDMTAAKVTENTTASSTHFVSQNVTLATGTQYVVSVFAKAAERRYVSFYSPAGGPFASIQQATFDLIGGAVTASSGVTAAGIVAGPDGWMRCWVTTAATIAAGSRNMRFYLRNGPGAVASYAGTIGSGAYFWGAQVEAGTALTDHQPVGATWSQNPTADPAAAFPDDIYFVDRKSAETRDAVEFELASSFDVAGVQLPRRQIIQNVCIWKYRGAECGYTGTSYFNAVDQPVGSAGLDVCGKRLSSCKARFGANAPLPFGSFPSAGLIR